MVLKKFIAAGSLSLLAVACTNIEDSSVGGVLPATSSESISSSSSLSIPLSSSSLAIRSSSSLSSKGNSSSSASYIEINTQGVECVVGDSTKGIVDTSKTFYCVRSSITGEKTWNIMPIQPAVRKCREGMHLWRGYQGVYTLDTECDVGSERSGYWYVETDSLYGGKSRVEWPVALGNEYSADALDPIIDHCDGVCGKYELEKASLEYNPYVKIGFNLGGEDAAGDIVPVDATVWDSVCIGYTVDTPAMLEMSFGQKGDEFLGYDLPHVTLPKAENYTIMTFKWSDFVQNGSGTFKISGKEGAANLVSLKFTVQSADGITGHFNIMTFGSSERGCGNYSD